MKGPYLEALPDYEKGRNLAELCQAGVLHADWMAMQGSPIWKRLLHIHQETALLHAAADDNYLVGTGTGSGKTEAFLYPMIDDILRDPDRARPGVRSVIVYPLNALANDQLYYRLAPLLLRELGDLGITFGRFTSAVGAGAERPQIEDQLRGNDARNGYAMLEHLLLLPRNAPLFAQAVLPTREPRGTRTHPRASRRHPPRMGATNGCAYRKSDPGWHRRSNAVALSG